MRENMRPECRWVVVIDDAGRRRLEMTWVLPEAPVVLPVGPVVSVDRLVRAA